MLHKSKVKLLPISEPSPPESLVRKSDGFDLTLLEFFPSQVYSKSSP